MADPNTPVPGSQTPVEGSQATTVGNTTTPDTTPVAPATTPQYSYITMPIDGLRGVALSLYSGDSQDEEKMRGHIRDLWLLNQDTLRTEDAFMAHQLVRIIEL